jgi:hypothetical protein
MATKKAEQLVRLEEIIQYGNRGHKGFGRNNIITCPDGFRVSVLAGGGTYCRPRPGICDCAHKGRVNELRQSDEVSHDFSDSYSRLEIGFPTERPEPWNKWEKHLELYDRELNDPTKAIYSYVPIAMVRALIKSHL